MKTIFTLAAIACLATIASCSKTAGPANGKSVQQNNHIDSTVGISAIINGIKWKTDSVFGYNVLPSGNDSSRINLNITATLKSPSSSMIFYITNYTGPKTYYINPPINTITYYSGNMRFIATTGQIDITQNTLVVKGDTAYSLTGTFSFTADTLTVSDGVFDIAKP